jgi:hypothetical protein
MTRHCVCVCFSPSTVEEFMLRRVKKKCMPTHMHRMPTDVEEYSTTRRSPPTGGVGPAFRRGWISAAASLWRRSAAVPSRLDRTRTVPGNRRMWPAGTTTTPAESDSVCARPWPRVSISCVQREQGPMSSTIHSPHIRHRRRQCFRQLAATKPWMPISVDPPRHSTGRSGRSRHS